MKLKCTLCPTHPYLEDSGREWPDDAICPVCDTLYDKESGVTSQEYRDLAEAHGIDLEKKKAELKRKPLKLPPYMRGIHRGK